MYEARVIYILLLRIVIESFLLKNSYEIIIYLLLLHRLSQKWVRCVQYIGTLADHVIRLQSRSSLHVADIICL